MLSFASSLGPNIQAITIFVNEKYDYRSKKGILSSSVVQKINSFISTLKVEKDKEDISSFDISNQQKCFIIKIRKKNEDHYFQEIGGTFYSELKKFKHIKNIYFYVDSLDFDKENLAVSFSEFIFGFNLKSYQFNKYKTSNNEKIN